MGRPKKNNDERRDFSIIFRCTASEYSDLLAKAEQVEQPINSFARAAALAGKVKVVQEQRLDFDTRHELRAIGNNLNQIAHALNASRSVAPATLETALQRLHAFFDEVFANDPACRR